MQPLCEAPITEHWLVLVKDFKIRFLGQAQKKKRKKKMHLAAHNVSPSGVWWWLHKSCLVRVVCLQMINNVRRIMSEGTGPLEVVTACCSREVLLVWCRFPRSDPEPRRPLAEPTLPFDHVQPSALEAVCEKLLHEAFFCVIISRANVEICRVEWEGVILSAQRNVLGFICWDSEIWLVKSVGHSQSVQTWDWRRLWTRWLVD